MGGEERREKGLTEKEGGRDGKRERAWEVGGGGGGGGRTTETYYLQRNEKNEDCQGKTIVPSSPPLSSPLLLFPHLTRLSPPNDPPFSPTTQPLFFQTNIRRHVQQ